MAPENSQQDWYQRSPEGYTVCIFGRVGSGHKPELNRVNWGSEAYECSQGYAYLKEHIRILKAKGNGKIPNLGLFAYLYIALAIFQQQSAVEFEELGSTFFTSIDLLEAIEAKFKTGLNVRDIHFTGVELSDWFSDMALALHSGYKISQFKELTQTPDNGMPKVAYNWVVANYACTSTEEFVEWVTKSRFTVCGAWFSLGAETHGDALGKRLVFFDLKAFVEQLMKLGYTVCSIRDHVMRNLHGEYRQLVFAAHNLGEEKITAFESRLASIAGEGIVALDLHRSVSLDVTKATKLSGGGIHLRKKADNATMSGTEFDWGGIDLYESMAQHAELAGNAVDAAAARALCASWLLLKKWDSLMAKCPRICLYGAGKYTHKLLDVLSGYNRPLPLVIWDDVPHVSETHGIRVQQTPTSFPSDIEVVVLGSDTFQERMRSRLSVLSGVMPEIVDLSH